VNWKGERIEFGHQIAKSARLPFWSAALHLERRFLVHRQSFFPNPRFAWRPEQIIPGALQSIPKLERPPKTANPTPQPFFPKPSNIGQRFIPSCLIISVELKNLLDSSVFKINPLCLFRCYSR
jgi:hypothetical protein